MRVSMGIPESHFEYKAMLKFKEHLAKTTKIDVQLFPSNQLGSDQEVLESMRMGVTHMNLPDPAVLANMVKEYNILSFPFIFDSQATANKVVDGPWGQELLKRLEKKGYVGLGFGDFGFRHITNSVRPFKTVADLQGLKIRTMQNPLHLEVFRELGANPTPMAFPEVFSSLQQGVIDGQENPLKNIASNKLYEVQDHLTLNGHVYAFVVFVVAQRFYDALSPEAQKELHVATQIAIQEMRQAVKKEDADSLEVIKKSGVQVHVLDPQEKQKMAALGEPVKERYANEIDPELYQFLKREVQKVQTPK